MVPKLIECRTEARRRSEAPEAQHRVVALLYGAMALLGVVVQVLRRAVQRLATEDPANRPPIRAVQVRSDASRLALRNLDQPAEEPSGRVAIAGVTEHGGDEGAV